MASELDCEAARGTGHKHERRIRSLRPSLRTNNNVVVAVATGYRKPI